MIEEGKPGYRLPLLCIQFALVGGVDFTIYFTVGVEGGGSEDIDSPSTARRTLRGSRRAGGEKRIRLEGMAWVERGDPLPSPHIELNYL